jgi:hypothetical protein
MQRPEERLMADDQEVATVRDTVTFLRMAVAEMRRMATDHPDLADRLRVLVNKCEAEIGELTERFRLPAP